MGTDYFLKRRQNTLILCYVKQRCLPNKLCFMTKPAEPGLDRVFLSESKVIRSYFLPPSALSLLYMSSKKIHLVSFDTTNTTNTVNSSLKLNSTEDDSQLDQCLQTCCWLFICWIIFCHVLLKSYIVYFCVVCTTFIVAFISSYFIHKTVMTSSYIACRRNQANDCHSNQNKIAP